MSKKFRGNRNHTNNYYTSSAKNAPDRPKGMFGSKDKKAADARKARLKAERKKSEAE